MARYEESNQFFVNPYNFVPVNLNKTERGDVTKQNEKLTGYLQCSIKCRTPLAIPDVEKKTPSQESPDHYEYPFFTVDGKPVIPGSAIRGVIRNVYETLTDSCFGAMQGDVAITARSSQPFKAGLLKRNENKWELYEAERRLVVVDGDFYANRRLEEKGVHLYDTTSLREKDNLKTGEKIYFDLSKNKYYKNGNEIGTYVEKLDKKSGRKQGYLCFGENAPRRHFQSIFEQQGLVQDVTVTNSDIQKMEDVLNEYRDDKKNRLYGSKHKGYPDYENAKSAGVVPVYYKVQDGRLYMTFAALGRKAYNKTWDEVTAEKSHRKCDGRKKLCPACALFGTAEGDKLGSRIRFTDANCMKDVTKKYVTFAELGSPRMSYTPFYLKENKPNANYADGYDSPDLEIRGRKFYWHHSPKQGNNIRKNNRNATFEVINKGTEFDFRVYFDGITERQLDLLAMSLHLNENNLNGNMCHKMGHGKPLGYGSVKIYIKSCKCRLFNPEKGWKEEDRKIPCNVECDCGDETKNSFDTICNFDTVNQFKVEYPEILFDRSCGYQRFQLKENVLASHKWFTENYKLGNNAPRKKLPDILDNDKTLEKYTATNIRNNDLKGQRRPN